MTEVGVGLWPHQVRAVEAVHEAIRGGKAAGLLAMPTGAGKTVTFLRLARELGWPALVVAHRDELIRQAVGAAGRVWPAARVGVVQGDRDEWDGGQDLVVASVQSLHPRRLERMPQDRFGLVVIDEAHHAAADSYRRVLDHFAGRRFVLGVSATPERADGVGLSRWFGERPLFVYEIRQAVADGVLVPPVQFQVRTGVSLDSVGSRCGDLAEGELADAVNTPARNRAIVEAFRERAGDRRAVAFCVDVRHARDLAEAFRAAGVASEVITGDVGLEDRRRLLASFSESGFQVATTCALLVEGYDDPSVSCVVMARPTASRALYLQALGRGLRRHPGKADCLVLDVTDNCVRHKLLGAHDLLDVRRPERRHEGCEASGRGEDLADEKTPPVLEWRLREVSPWPSLPDLTGYRPTEFWHGHRATDAQLRCLRGFGLDVTRGLTKGEAHFLIDQAAQLEASHPAPATERQRWLLRREGRWKPGMGKKEATRVIAAIKGGAAAGA